MAFDASGRLFVAYLLSKANQNGPGFGQPDLFIQQLDARQPGVAVASRQVDAALNDCNSAAANASQCPVNVTNQLGLGACNDVTAGRNADRLWLSADTHPACTTNPPPPRSTRTCSPFSNNLYVTWTDSNCGAGGPQVIQVASSSDQGVTWANQALATAPGDLRQVGFGIAANGDAYAGFHAQNLDQFGQPDGTSGQILVFQSQTGTAAGFGASTSQTVPFPAPLADVTRNQQQCTCPGTATCQATGVACSFSANNCPNGTNCQCPAPDVCVPPAGCANSPITGFQPCSRRLSANDNLTWGSDSPFIVGDPTNPNNIAVFASTDPNRAGTARDNFDVNYVIATNAATSTPTWSAPQTVTPSGVGLPGTNQLFPAAAVAFNSACVTLSYYDDRNTTIDAQGNNLLDVYVTVNPNLWGSGAWQQEVKVNHTSFNPDVGGGDFFSYCGSISGCTTPAGWRSTSRMGEYYGLAQAFGLAWTGNTFSGSTATGQQILFDYPDGIAPVVTPPANTTVNTCQPTVASLGTASSSDQCGLPPLSTPTATVGQLNPGANSVTWSSTDGAGNKGSATQTVTVNDTTRPTLQSLPDALIPSCDGGTITVGLPTGSDDCPGQLTFTGKVISKNGVALSPPINVTVVNNTTAQVSLGFGTYVISWTATDASGNVSTAITQNVTIIGKIEAGGTFQVDNNASVQDSTGGGGAVLNDGNGTTLLEVSATTGSITSVASVQVADFSTVNGTVVTAGTFTSPNDKTWKVTGGTPTQHASVVLPALPQLLPFPPPVGMDVFANGPGPTPLTPGSYPNVYVNSGGTLSLAGGDYFFESLHINSTTNVHVQVTPETRIQVLNQLDLRTPFLNASNQVQPIFLGFAGTNVSVETQFSGTFLAPNAAVTFGIGNGITYLGSFYAKSIEVRDHSVLVCNEGFTPELPVLTTPVSCTDHVKDGDETDVDCGGTTCPACANGKQCVSNSDCTSADCVAGTCQTLTNGQFSAELKIFADWGTGYCADVLVTNTATTPTKNWTITVNTGASTTYDTWNATFSGTTGTITVTPNASWDQVIPAKASNDDTQVGFCANRTPPSSGALPVVVSASASF